MANVIKHKRGSGSDPGASDLVVGEVAIRTDVGKLFTKMDNGSVAEIAGGGSDIVYGFGGDDRIEVSGSGDVVIDTGGGSDEVVVEAGALGSIDITSEGTNNILIFEEHGLDGPFAGIVINEDDSAIADFHGNCVFVSVCVCDFRFRFEKNEYVF